MELAVQSMERVPVKLFMQELAAQFLVQVSQGLFVVVMAPALMGVQDLGPAHATLVGQGVPVDLRAREDLLILAMEMANVTKIVHVPATAQFRLDTGKVQIARFAPRNG